MLFLIAVFFVAGLGGDHGDVCCQFGKRNVVLFLEIFFDEVFDDTVKFLVSIGLQASPNDPLILSMIPGDILIPAIEDDRSPGGEVDSAGHGLVDEDAVVVIFDDHGCVIWVIEVVPKSERVKNLWALAKK